MQQILPYFILIPFLGFFINILLPHKKERLISQLAIFTVGLHMAFILIFGCYWFYMVYIIKTDSADIKHFTNNEYHLSFYFDKITAVYSMVGSILIFLVSVFSRFYMHRDQGFKRFFNNLLFFYCGYNLVIFSGNTEVLFIGWEIVGICSFLLITFYRDRYLPVKNGFKVISILNLSDLCLALVMWMSHNLWNENISFFTVNNNATGQIYLQSHPSYLLFIAIMFLIAAIIKSAQLPFSTWLPRAMEGPTTSSAIFYGALSVHLGVFLLLRTFPLWESFTLIKATVIIIGLLTALIAAGISKVQSSIKIQIAYSSIAQIGLMFVEIALGYHNLALIHFAGNAFLRSYQLLVSPSILSYLIHNQFYHFNPAEKKDRQPVFKKLSNSFYVLSTKEWNLEFYLKQFLWDPFKWAGNKLAFLENKSSLIVLGVFFLSGLYCIGFSENINKDLFEHLPIGFSFFALILVLRTFAGRGDAIKSWTLLFINQFFISLAISINLPFGLGYILLFIGAAILSFVVGYICLHTIKKIDNNIQLNQFHGYSYEKPRIALVFLLACLGILGIPITPYFIGVDLIYSHIDKDQTILLSIISLSFILMELSVIRIYARIFMGLHKKAEHAMVFKSS